MTGPLRDVRIEHPNGVTNTLTAHGRATIPHHPAPECDPVHCYSHHVDERPHPRRAPYEMCGECFHVYRTRWHLWWDSTRDRARVYWRDLTHPWTPDRTATPTPLPATADSPFLDPAFAWPSRISRWAAAYALALAPFHRPAHITFCPHCIHDL